MSKKYSLGIARYRPSSACQKRHPVMIRVGDYGVVGVTNYLDDLERKSLRQTSRTVAEDVCGKFNFAEALETYDSDVPHDLETYIYWRFEWRRFKQLRPKFDFRGLKLLTVRESQLWTVRTLSCTDGMTVLCAPDVPLDEYRVLIDTLPLLHMVLRPPSWLSHENICHVAELLDECSRWKHCNRWVIGIGGELGDFDFIHKRAVALECSSGWLPQIMSRDWLQKLSIKLELPGLEIFGVETYRETVPIPSGLFRFLTEIKIEDWNGEWFKSVEAPMLTSVKLYHPMLDESQMHFAIENGEHWMTRTLRLDLNMSTVSLDLLQLAEKRAGKSAVLVKLLVRRWDARRRLDWNDCLAGRGLWWHHLEAILWEGGVDLLAFKGPENCDEELLDLRNLRSLEIYELNAKAISSWHNFLTVGEFPMLESFAVEASHHSVVDLLRLPALRNIKRLDICRNFHLLFNLEENICLPCLTELRIQVETSKSVENLIIHGRLALTAPIETVFFDDAPYLHVYWAIRKLFPEALFRRAPSNPFPF